MEPWAKISILIVSCLVERSQEADVVLYIFAFKFSNFYNCPQVW